MKALLFLFIVLLTIYPPIELTRVILVDLELTCAYWGIPIWQFILEICFIWTFYLTAMALVSRLILRRVNV